MSKTGAALHGLQHWAAGNRMYFPSIAITRKIVLVCAQVEFLTTFSPCSLLFPRTLCLLAWPVVFVWAEPQAALRHTLGLIPVFPEVLLTRSTGSLDTRQPLTGSAHSRSGWVKRKYTETNKKSSPGLCWWWWGSTPLRLGYSSAYFHPIAAREDEMLVRICWILSAKRSVSQPGCCKWSQKLLPFLSQISLVGSEGGW